MTKTKFAVALGAAALTAMAGLTHAADPGALDRAALIKLADTYFGAMLAHDPKKAPLATDFKVVENVKRVTTSEGLWKTTTAAPTAFKTVVPDAMSQQVGGILVLESDSTP